ncbi:MAG: pyruvate dehydrogenase (acetyl-transferring) E1 component subunit alpha [Thaumarchaeota archaeon]|nr:pyruvate dehydrogenase (acetyl-transferring) E1 component subunit alpha [Nitrososphaerota archaeon]
MMPKDSPLESDDSSLGLLQVLRPDGVLTTEVKTGLSTTEVLSAYKNMVLTRILDEKLVALQRQGRMGTYVSCSGQEASQIGTVLALNKDDWVFPMYRDVGMVVQKGVPFDSLMNRLFGNSEDESLGRDLPNAFGWKKYQLFTLAAPIASHLQPAVGFGMAARSRGDRIVTVASFGDGATSSGEFHVSMNFAGVYKAPTIFVCENNQYAISVPVSRQTASETIALKAKAYGFEGVRVDGNDLFAVYLATREAAEKARNGGGPTLIECVTYRLGAHSTSDDWKKYRSTDEVEEWKKKDPLIRLRLYLEKSSLWSEAQERDLRKQQESQINQAISKAEKIPLPKIETMFADVSSKISDNLKEEMDELLSEKWAKIT